MASKSGAGPAPPLPPAKPKTRDLFDDIFQTYPFRQSDRSVRANESSATSNQSLRQEIRPPPGARSTDSSRKIYSLICQLIFLLFIFLLPGKKPRNSGESADEKYLILVRRAKETKHKVVTNSALSLFTLNEDLLQEYDSSTMYPEHQSKC